jgi:hypothetical protein
MDLEPHAGQFPQKNATAHIVPPHSKRKNENLVRCCG